MAKKLWGGRFKKEIDKDFFKFQQSIFYDYRLAIYDILHSIAHVKTLYKSKILTGNEFNKIFKALQEIDKEISENDTKHILEYNKINEIEDIHTYIQERVEEKVGATLALKLHSLRSRNDQIVFDEKQYCLAKVSEIRKVLLEFCKNLKDMSDKYKDLQFVGYTHTQRAQGISLKTYLRAYMRMFLRDDTRLSNYYDNLFIYIGAGALTGSSLYKKDYNEAVKEMLKDFKKIKQLINSIDNVSDRDFIIELLIFFSILQMHLSRLAEDLILYSTKEFDFVDLPEEFCTGSSFMPHKKNPDFLELVRGHTGTIYGNLLSILTTMKGLPLTYNRDMQLDKGPLFSSVEIIKDELKIMTKFINKIKFHTKIIDLALHDKNLYATKLA